MRRLRGLLGIDLALEASEFAVDTLGVWKCDDSCMSMDTSTILRGDFISGHKPELEKMLGP